MWLKFQFFGCNQLFRKKKNFEYKKLSNQSDSIRQFFATNLKICKVKVRLENSYHPNSDYPNFFININEILESN